jgi:hypothetical protein
MIWRGDLRTVHNLMTMESSPAERMRQAASARGSPARLRAGQPQSAAGLRRARDRDAAGASELSEGPVRQVTDSGWRRPSGGGDGPPSRRHASAGEVLPRANGRFATGTAVSRRDTAPGLSICRRQLLAIGERGSSTGGVALPRRGLDPADLSRSVALVLQDHPTG